MKLSTVGCTCGPTAISMAHALVPQQLTGDQVPVEGTDGRRIDGEFQTQQGGLGVVQRA